eukprot:6183613-Pleurochrysis_carterae.AAC.5
MRSIHACALLDTHAQLQLNLTTMLPSLRIRTRPREGAVLLHDVPCDLRAGKLVQVLPSMSDSKLAKRQAASAKAGQVRMTQTHLS